MSLSDRHALQKGPKIFIMSCPVQRGETIENIVHLEMKYMMENAEKTISPELTQDNSVDV